MKISGEHLIAAPRRRVWDVLNDPDALRAAIPGCRSLDRLSADAMAVTVEAAVGSLKATFEGELTLSDRDAPNKLRLTGEGKGAAGNINGAADVSLSDAGDDSTRLSYTATAEVGGKLAEGGSRLVGAGARKVADEFFAALAARATEGPIARVEHAVEHAVEETEERAEEAAVRGFLGGPQMWALLALIVVVLALLIAR